MALYLVVDTGDHFYNNPYLVTDNYDEAVERADQEQAAVIEIYVGHYRNIYERTEEAYDTEEEETQDYDESEEEYIDENEEYESEDEASQSITFIAEVFEAS